MPSFGYSSGSGGRARLAGSGEQVYFPFENTTGDYILIDQADLVNVTDAMPSTTAQISLYAPDAWWVPGPLLGVSATKSSLTVGTNTFTFSSPVLVAPGMRIWVGFRSTYIFDPVYCSGIGDSSELGLELEYPASTGFSDPWPKSTTPSDSGNIRRWFANGLILPVVLSGSVDPSPPTTNLRASSIDAESLQDGDSSIRSALMVSEPLAEGTPQFRVSIYCSEVLYPVEPEGHMSTEILPELPGLAFEVKKTPVFNTRTAKHVSGRQVRNAFMQYPIWKFTLTYDYLPDKPVTVGETALRNLCGFFLQRQGSFDTWLFKDVDDYTVTNEAQATADGVTLQFPFCRSFGGFLEPVGQINTDEAYAVYVDGVLQVEGVDYDITMPNQIVFAVAPADGLPITATFEYYFVCHFTEDSAEFSKFSNQLWELQKMEFESIIE